MEAGSVAKEPRLVIVHEIFLDRVVEPFGVSIHVEASGIGPTVSLAALSQAVLASCGVILVRLALAVSANPGGAKLANWCRRVRSGKQLHQRDRQADDAGCHDP